MSTTACIPAYIYCLLLASIAARERALKPAKDGKYLIMPYLVYFISEPYCLPN
jgi:hypothetical protein